MVGLHAGLFELPVPAATTVTDRSVLGRVSVSMNVLGALQLLQRLRLYQHCLCRCCYGVLSAQPGMSIGAASQPSHTTPTRARPAALFGALRLLQQ